MTEIQKNQTDRLRKAGYGYARIASMLGLSKETIKSYCKRRDLSGFKGTAPRGKADEHFCQQCGMSVPQTKGRKEKKFCSDECRMAWWNEHPDMVKRKKYYEFVCLYCNKKFTAYGNAHRKYCSRECSFKDRFKK